MKGTYFQRPLEFKIDIEGESWNQGETIQGTLTVKNHGAEVVNVGAMRVELARANFRDVRAKAADAFESLAEAPLPTDTAIEPQKDMSFPWSFTTGRDCPITDTTSSLFLVYGTRASSEFPGQLQLAIQPDPVIQEFIERLEIGFRFVVKSKKFTKGLVEVKFAPPDAKGFAAVEQLGVGFKFEGDTLNVKYSFAVKQVEASAAAVDLKKGKKTFEQNFGPQVYRTASGRFNHEAVESALREILGQIESKPLY